MRERVIRILLDTSFLLPILGFKTNTVIMNVMDKSRKYDVYYSDLSIIVVL